MQPSVPSSSSPDAQPASADGVLEAALESMPYGFCLWDDDFRLVLCNERFGELYRIDRTAPLIGATLPEIFQASVETRDDTDYQDQLAGITRDETFVTEETLISGRTVKISYRRAEPQGWTATYEDVTEQRDQVMALQQREHQLAQQNIRFEAAVDNMSQGLCMFDSEWRLVIYNRRYAEFYDTPSVLLRPGTPLEALLRDRVKRGYYPGGDSESYVQRRLAVAIKASPGTDIVELRDGRVMAIIHHPMADGGWVATHQDITEQRRANERILHLARHDTLTDLPNRRFFQERTKAAETRIAGGETVAILIIDLDHYKSINDVFGHGVGDSVLIEVASRLSAICRDGDTVARLGGDEFAILRGGITSHDEVRALAEDIVDRVAQPMTFDNHEVNIGASVGVALAPHDGRKAQVLMRNADLALYRAKSEGRNTFQFYRPAMNTALQKRLAVETQLRIALAGDQFDVAFQPFLDFDQQRIAGFEALLRWRHPNRGILMPEEFMVIAEETGLIVPIGEWFLRAACAEAAKWPDHVQVAIDLSPIQFRNRNLAERIGAILDETGLPARRLEIEVTEPELRADAKVTIETLRKLRHLGVGIVLDEFGAGDASVGFLRSFPFDKIKIDPSFIEEVSNEAAGASIVGAIIDLGRSLGMSMTAAGVEKEAQLEMVRDRGCRQVQGTLISPPLPPGAVSALFAGTGDGPDEVAGRLASR